MKPIALTEFGGVPDIEKMQRLGVWWSWFASWHGAQYGPQSTPNADVQRTYQSAAVITRNELAAPPPADSNGDGVLDSEAAALGFPPALDLGPAIAFFRANADRFDLGHSQAELTAALLDGRLQILAAPNPHGLFTATHFRSLAIGQPFLTRDPASGNFSLNLGLKQSSTLTDWSPVVPTEMNLRPGGILELKLPAAGDAAFFRLLGEAP